MRVKESGIASNMAGMQIGESSNQPQDGQPKVEHRAPGYNNKCQWKKAMRPRMMQAAMAGHMPPFMQGPPVMMKGPGPAMMWQRAMAQPFDRWPHDMVGRMPHGPGMMAPWMHAGAFFQPPPTFEMGHPKQMLKMWKFYFKVQRKISKDIIKKQKKGKSKAPKSREKISEEGMMTEDNDIKIEESSVPKSEGLEVQISSDESKTDDESGMSHSDSSDDEAMNYLPPFMMPSPWMYGPPHMGRGRHACGRGRGRHSRHDGWRRRAENDKNISAEEDTIECAEDTSKERQEVKGVKNRRGHGKGCPRRMRMFRQAMMEQGMPPMWMHPNSFDEQRDKAERWPNQSGQYEKYDGQNGTDAAEQNDENFGSDK